MTRHGKSRDGIKTISTKIEEKYLHKLDEVKRSLNFKHRSEVIRMAVKLFLENQ